MFHHGRRSVLPRAARPATVGTSADDSRIGEFEAFEDLRQHALALGLERLRHLIRCLRALLLELEDLAERLAADRVSQGHAQGIADASPRRQASASWNEG